MTETKNSTTFVPELWSEVMIDQFKHSISIKRRSYGERLLRAAAKGEDWTEIEREHDITIGEITNDIRENITNHAADVLRYAIDASMLSHLGNGTNSTRK